ncbi:nuclear protein localization protein 4 [Coemansia sp. RSA 1933]|nr:nuclear protein localization protein 4 [Coemansia sp. RSA 1933]
MIIRVRTPEGTHRIEMEPQESLALLLEKLAPLMKSPAADAILLTRDPAGQQIIAEFEQSIVSLGLKHGDMLFAKVAASARPSEEPRGATSESSRVSQAGAGKVVSSKTAFVKQDPVDYELEKDDGLIKRKRDARFCKHGANAMCEYCLPVEPYDKEHLAKNNIKHMPLYAYLRQKLAQSKVVGDISGSIPPNLPLPLEDPDYNVKDNCTSGHLPWPEGICSKCQPPAITLQRQTFRMVDNVEFATPDLIQNLLSFWIKSRCQRFGLLYGRYTRSTDIPLGVKAVVEAIYEPKQSWEEDGVKVAIESAEFEEEIKRVDAVAEACGIKLVGMIFTDVEATNEANKVVYSRHANSYFLTALECRLAAYMQNRNKNSSRWASGGHFGSKFVTCCVTGNQDGDIDVTAWQVSNSAMAMQKADLIVPSNVPSKLCIHGATKTRYVPDVFYTYTNEYNLAVSANAKPAFPVEYLLVNLTQGFPLEPRPLFISTKPFGIENRDHVHQRQTLGMLKQHIEGTQASPEALRELFMDFHFLVYIASLGFLSQEEVQLAGSIVSESEQSASVRVAAQLVESAGWQTLQLALQEASASDLGHTGAGSAMEHMADAGFGGGTGETAGTSQGAASDDSSTWACRHCTFVNGGGKNSCEITYLCTMAKQYKTIGEETWKNNVEKVNAELFIFTYGSLVVQLVNDYEDYGAVNKQLDKMGYNIGMRLIDDILARTGLEKCADFHTTAEVISKVGFKVFLNIAPSVQSWSSDGKEFSIILDDNPLNDFCELPPKAVQDGLWYSNVLCGVIRGALEMMQMQTEVFFVRDALHGADVSEIRVKLVRILDEEVPANDE